MASSGTLDVAGAGIAWWWVDPAHPWSERSPTLSRLARRPSACRTPLMVRMVYSISTILLLACGSSGGGTSGPDEYIEDCESLPAGASTFASDESYDAFVNAEAANKVVADAAKAPRLSAPAAGATM